MGATGQVGKGDVLDVISKKGLHRLREVTVFTTVTGALPDEVTLGGIHQAQSGWYYPYFRYCV